MANIYPMSEIELPNGDILIIESQGENQSQILPFVLPEEFGAIGDGTADDTYAIEQAFMTKKPVLFDKTKIYYITSIVLDSNSILLGNGSTLLFDGSKADGGIVIKDNKENVYIENCILKAKHIDKKNGRGINIANSKNIKIYNCHIDGQAVDENGNFKAWVENNSINGYGSYNGISIENSKYITIDNCSIKNVWSQGLTSSYSKHIIISNNHIENIGRGGIYVMGGNDNVEISSNTLINCVKYFNVADAAIDVYGELITAKELEENPNRKAIPNTALKIINNYIKGFGSDLEPGCGIIIKGTYGAVCENNTIVSDENTYPLAGIMIQERNRTGVKDCIINNNTVQIEKCFERDFTSEHDVYIPKEDVENPQNNTIVYNPLDNTAFKYNSSTGEWVEYTGKPRNGSTLYVTEEDKVYRYDTTEWFIVTESDYQDKYAIEAKEFAHLIRIFDAISSKDIIISNNVLKTNQRGVNGITLRGNSENIVIENNIIETIRHGIQSKNAMQKKFKITNNTIRGRVSLIGCEEVSINNNDIYLCIGSPDSKHGAIYIGNSKDIIYKYNYLKNKSDEAVFEFFENCDEDTIDIQNNVYYNADGTLTNQRVIRQSFMTAVSTAKPNTTLLLLKDNYNTLISLTGEKNHGKRLDTTGADYYQNSVKFPENLTLKGALANAGVALQGISITSGMRAFNIYEQVDIQNAILPKGLTIENLTLRSDFCLRNCQMENLKIVNCIFGTNATIQLDPQRLKNKYGQDLEDSQSETRHGYHKLRLINPIIKNCTFNNTGMSKTTDICSIYARCVDGIVVQNNTVTGPKGDGIQITGFSGSIGGKGACRSCGKIIIGNNTIKNTTKRGIRLSYLEDADIELSYNTLTNVCANGDLDQIKANYFYGYNNKFAQIGNTVDGSVDNLHLTVEELKQINDYIIEQEIIENEYTWFYRKWNSGTVELHCSNLVINDYYYDEELSRYEKIISFPAPIENIYSLILTPRFNSSSVNLSYDIIDSTTILIYAEDEITGGLSLVTIGK